MPITITGVRFSYCNLFQPKAPYNNPQGGAEVQLYHSGAQDQHGGEGRH